jgi:hypothetical protein
MTDARETPGVIRLNRALLFVSLGVWLIGSISGGLHLSKGLAGHEGVMDLRADVSFLAQRVFLFIASAVGIFAVSRRWSLGRWVSIGLGVVMLYRSWRPLAYAWRAIWGEFAAPPGLLAYTSTEEAFIAMFVSVAIVLVVATVVLQLAFSSDARRYFSSGDPGNNGEAA